jgi:hypothetical protein
LGAHSPDQVMELVRCQVLADDEASIRELQDKLKENRKWPLYREAAVMVLERLQKQYPAAYIMSFRRRFGKGWVLTVAELTKSGAEDNGTVAFAQQIAKELGVNKWFQIAGPETKP